APPRAVVRQTRHGARRRALPDSGLLLQPGRPVPLPGLVAHPVDVGQVHLTAEKQQVVAVPAQAGAAARARTGEGAELIKRSRVEPPLVGKWLREPGDAVVALAAARHGDAGAPVIRHRQPLAAARPRAARRPARQTALAAGAAVQPTTRQRVLAVA